MASEEAQRFLEQTGANRGYTLEMHRIMAEADLEWAQKYNAFIEATYTGQRMLDRKTKELLQIVVEAALRADVEQIQAHVRVALQEGATPGRYWRRCRRSSHPWERWLSGGACRHGPRRRGSIRHRVPKRKRPGISEIPDR